MGKQKKTQKKLKFSPPDPYENREPFAFDKNGNRIAELTGMLTRNDMIVAVVQYVKTKDDEFKYYPANMAPIHKIFSVFSKALAQTEFSEPYAKTLDTDFIDVHDAIIQTFDCSTASDNQAAQQRENQIQYVDFLCSDQIFFGTLPCFTKGCIRVSHMQHIVWNILDIDIEQKTYSIELKLYSSETTQDFAPTWWPKTQFRVDLTVESDGCIPREEFRQKQNLPFIRYKIPVEHILSSVQILNSIKPTLLFPNKNDRAAWRNSVLSTEERIREHNERANQSQQEAVLYEFLFSIIFTNMVLQRRKTQKTKTITAPLGSPQNATNTTPVSQHSETEKVPQTAPARVIHHIDMVTIKSTERPRCPTQKSVANYRVSSWLTRGHIRHYKSGKTVYIKPAIHKRKKLNETTDNRPKQTIHIRNNTPEE